MTVSRCCTFPSQFGATRRRARIASMLEDMSEIGSESALASLAERRRLSEEQRTPEPRNRTSPLEGRLLEVGQTSSFAISGTE